MWSRIRASILLVPALSSVLSGQAPHIDSKAAAAGWKSGACEGPFAKRLIADQQFAMKAMSSMVDPREALRHGGASHDGLLTLAQTGDEDSVPLLIRQLGRDYGTKELSPFTSFLCTQSHLIEALKAITNTDQGMFYPGWSAWWQANGHRTRRQWMLDGFTAQSLHVADPIDERFGRELIASLNGKPFYSSRSARLLLDGVDPVSRAKWLASAAVSDDRLLRLGAITYLEHADEAEGESVIKTLMGDSDAGISAHALALWNGRRRKVLSSAASVSEAVCKVEPVGALAFAGDVLIVASSQRVTAINPSTLLGVWSYPIKPGMADFLLPLEKRLILASSSGEVLALGLNGKPLWQRPSDGNAAEVRHVVERAGDIVLVRDDGLELLDEVRGVTKFSVKSLGEVAMVASSGGSVCYADGAGSHCLNRTANQYLKRDMSAGGDALCLAENSDNGFTLPCLDPRNLSIWWNEVTSGHKAPPPQREDRVYLSAERDLAAYLAADGSVAWRSSELRADESMPTDYGLLFFTERRLELRDGTTGEVRSVGPKLPLFRRQVAVHGELVAVTGDGALWLVNLGHFQ